jgi:DNA polymerase-1
LEKLIPLFERLGLKSLLKRLENSGQTVGAPLEKGFADGDYQKIESEKALSEALEKVKENFYFQLYLDGPRFSALYFKAENACFCATDAALLPAFRPVFEEEALGKITHGAKAVYLFLHEKGMDLKGLAFDTEIAAYLLNSSASGYDLAGLYYDETGVKIAPASEKQPKQTSLFDEPAAAADVSRYRACFALEELERLQREKLETQGMTRLFEDVELPLIEVLASMQETGVKVDKEKLEAFGKSLQADIETLAARIYEAAGEEFNLNSPKQLGTVLFDKLQLPHAKKTKTGYSTNAEVLEKLRGFHPIIDDVLQYRQYSKLKSTYADGLALAIDPKTGKIHSNFNQTVTTTGRISSTEPNLQNIPVRTALGREIRKMFVVSGDGWVFVDADYSQIELRVLAHVSGDETMRRAFADGEDVHASTAANIFGVPQSEVTGEMRTAAKAINFGLMYGMGEFSLSQDLKVSRKRAAEYIEGYLGRYPKVREYMRGAVAFAKENGYAVTALGRRRETPQLKSGNFNERAFGERIAMNAPIQGLAADIIKLAMVRVFREMKRMGLASRLILQVHDEIIVEAKTGEADTVQKIVRAEMENALAMDAPLKADIHTGKSWFEAK